MHRDPAYKKFEVLPITGALGAEIRGVDLQTADEATFEEVRSVLDNYHVLAVRDQKLDPHKLQKVARRFGPFSDNPVHASMEGAENIIRFVREPDDTGMVIGENWHMDLAWLPKPPGITHALWRGDPAGRRRHLLRQPRARLSRCCRRS